MSFPPCYVHGPTTTHTNTIILLHGRGSNGPEFAGELFEGCTSAKFNLAQVFPGWKWVFPSSKSRWDTVFKEMPEWFDIHSLTDTSAEEPLQIEGLKEGVEMVLGLLEDEVRSLGDSRKVVLGGISQGEAMALQTFLCSQRRLGAIVGISGWLPLKDHVRKIANEESGGLATVAEFCRAKLGLKNDNGCLHNDAESMGETPVFLGHGVDDAFVDVGLGQEVREILEKLQMKVTWKEYVGADNEGHWLKDPEEFDDIASFLKDQAL